jgi:2,4-dienoyl-CoA reductase-like NADH-dependent reductase (Old Yellow Enzyme family)
MRTGLLFESMTLAGLALRNRVVMAPMTRTFAPHGVPTAANVEYYRRRAAGGVGLIITEGTFIDHPAAGDDRDIPRMYGSAAIDGWGRVVHAVHEAGARIIPQLWHLGMQRRADVARATGTASVGPSGDPERDHALCRAMTSQDIADVVDAYARAAVTAQRLGFDGVEVHGAHGYLIDEFFWDRTNRRTDSYGGSLRNRARLACEIVEAIKNRTGGDFPVSFRISQWKQQDYTAKLATSVEQWAELLGELARAGVDLFHVSTRRYADPAFPGDPEPLAAVTRRVTGRPVITVGSVGLNDAKAVGWEKDGSLSVSTVHGTDDLERRIGRHEFDLVAIGRALLANPEWASHVQHGRFDKLRPYTLAARDTLL